LREIARICEKEQLWFHVDGAYGGFAAVLPDAPPDLKALALADSVAVDPHKWLYAPLEAGCTLVRDPSALTEAFSYQPPYYRYSADDEEEPVNFHERGPQNSRGFRALKVWLGLRQAGREGYVRMIGDDIRLARELFERAAEEPELETLTYGLSIATFRYVPADLAGDASAGEYLNELNTELMRRIRASGAAWVSNALVGGKFALRACVVNFRTTSADIASLPPLAVALGRAVDEELRPALRAAGR
ncbi:MAG TPA: pyridoxal-dependent decarboxylase, partial [Thermoanaerobaculia bacterium]|nr:pyridoxal-dependent decarboxylase [Thermoanaerobaculia bacterium]